MIKDINRKDYIKKKKNAKKETIDLSEFPQENPNPVFRISADLRIIYANAPAEIILEKLGIKDEKIPKKLIDSTMALLKKKSDSLFTLEYKIGNFIYEFSIVKVEDGHYYNIYGTDITDRKRQEKLRQKTDKKAILSDDRNYIARELHDTVTQTLFSANLIAEVLPKLWKKDPETVIKRLDEIRMLNNLALTEMRALLYDLKPSFFKNENLAEHIKELVRSMGIKTKIPISVEIVKKYEYSHRVELSFYRIAQEALNNIAKHSSATKAKLVLKSLSDKITLDIIDDGIGFKGSDTNSENFGLIIMKERAKMIGASLNIKSSPGNGTRVSVIYSNNKNKKNYEQKR